MTVTISDWSVGFRKIEFNDLLREFAGCGLAEAKRAVDRLLDHEPLVIEIPDDEAAEEFVRRAIEIGAVIRPTVTNVRERAIPS